MKRAAAYLRSSKDRSDVSIAAQRRELEQLAKERDLVIVRTYEDTVESAKSEHRPGFQSLLSELKAKDREWDTLMAVDTSRLSRRRYVAQILGHECQKRGIRIIYSKVPEVDPISQVILDSVLQAMDEVHSLMSKEKGLAGMRENISRGFRAGGRPPFGYQLQAVATDAIREGAPVTKSCLAPQHPEFTLAQAYLQLRANGAKRTDAAQASGINRPSTSLIGMERQALTYAGHTVWNMTAERIPGKGGYVGGQKHRPRAEWEIQRNTHQAAISEAQAEAILKQLEESNYSKGHRNRTSESLLTGILVCPEGNKWEANRRKTNNGAQRYYRFRLPGRSKNIPSEAIDTPVMARMIQDFKSPRFIKALVKAAQSASNKDTPPELTAMSQKLKSITTKIDRLVDLSTEMEDPSAMLRRISDMEKERTQLAKAMESLQQEESAAAMLRGITESQVKGWLDTLAETFGDADQAQLRTLVQTMVQRITLDPESLETRIEWAFSAPTRGIKMASPGGFEPPLPP